MLALLLQGWHTEAGREAIVGGGVDITVSIALTAALSFLAHRHIIKRLERHHCEREEAAERRHREAMAALHKPPRIGDDA